MYIIINLNFESLNKYSINFIYDSDYNGNSKK